MRRFVAAVAAASVLFASTSALADDVARAEQLFREGKRLYGAGQLDAACAALAESDRLDPAVGTLGLLAACDERRGKLVAALRAYREVARRAAATKDDRAAFARERAEALDRRVPKLTVDVADPASEVRVDGAVLEPDAFGRPIPRDAGAVAIEATHRDGTTFSHRASLAEGASLVIAIPAPGRVEPAPSEAAGSPAPPWAAIGAAGVGVAGLAVMTGFGLSASGLDDDSRELAGECEAGSASACTQGEAARDDAGTHAGVATVGFVIGAAGLATGVLLWILHDDGAEPPPIAARGRAATWSVPF